MPLSAISYGIEPGHEEEIAEIFSPRNFRRVDSAAIRDENGEEVGKLLATGVFIQDTAMIRVIEYEGDIRRIGQHMARQEGVQEAERRIAPFLLEQRDTRDATGFTNHMRNSAIRCLMQRSIPGVPAARMLALRYPIKPGHEDQLAELFSAVRGEARPTLRGADAQDTGLLAGIALFVRGGDMFRVVQFDGEIEDVARYMATRGQRPEMERKLAPFLAEERNVDTVEGFLAEFEKANMRCISQLSIASLPVAH
jgi:hypothetical protein